MKYLVLILISLLSKWLFAQNSSLPLTRTAKTEVVDSLSKSLLKNYVFPDTASKMGNYIERRLKDGMYDQITNPNEFAQKLTTDLRSIYNDVHLSITYDPKMQRRLTDTSMINVTERRQQNLAEYRQQNFGFKKLEILSGNIGYVRFDQFYGFNEFSKEVVNTVFTFLKNANALIIDLRNNGGGSPDMVKYICSFLLPPGTHLSSFFERRTIQTETMYTYQPSIPVSFVDRPVYILVSRRSFSGAEAFSYDLQALHRATIIGENTGGGAHAVGPNIICNGFIGLIPYSRAINPITGTNWEGVGVKPDIKISADSSLDAAILSYYDRQLAHATDSGQIKKVTWPRDMLQAKLHPYQADTSLQRTYTGNFANRLVSLENGYLYYTGTDGKKARLIPLAPASFRITDVDYMKIDFVRNAQGQVSKMNFIFEDGFVASYEKKE